MHLILLAVAKRRKIRLPCVEGPDGKLLHPVQAEIVEAMTWIDLPVTGADLIQVLERTGLRVDYHVGRLCRLDILKPAKSGPGSRGFHLR